MKYQSRLFNFLNRGAIAFNDRLGKTARSVKIAASWGVQLLLYPLYLLVQTGHWTEKQIASKFKEKKHQLPTQKEQNQGEIEREEWINTEEILINILEEVKSLPLEKAEITLSPSLPLSPNNPHPPTCVSPNNPHPPTCVSPNNPHPPTPLSQRERGKKGLSQIRGIACLLGDKSLVLVGQNNEILNISTKEQQKLEQLIIAKTAINYSIQEKKTKKLGSNLPLININNNQIISPLKWFGNLMEWVQVGQVAQKINLFGESNLIINNQDQENLLLNIIQPSQIIINKLDDQLAKIEQEIEGEIIENDDPFQIQILILAAIEHFFGQSKDKGNFETSWKLPKTRLEILFFGKKNSFKTNINKPQLDEKKSEPEPDPWLTWEDLSSQKLEQNIIKTHSKKASKIPLLIEKNEPQLNNKPLNNLKNNVFKLLSGKNDNTLETIPKNKSQSTSNDKNFHLTKKKVILTTFNQQNKPINETKSNKNERTTNNIKYSPQWIETDAKPLGYDKNLLEIVLQGLDKLILIIEEIVIIIVKIVRKTLKKKK